ncbi:hypothetical protein AMTRI_Chr12g274030 [Amborella trichopoda]|uniref:Uncharacterized protein n=1 Tax=Amborella trichopoda TaxID=13333 RepID=W1PHN5_AMBTC|nr:uncharacterized protein LOC18435401 isoform X2 [Amborella trichopoda]ERN07184.1 hypothetical protein AMTR_s00019p00158670 [Amborella trichopoda]|eukprot:XP_006845509.1 uncharacterized protein LOC18435401 isoform X2 [Amborella trichopoda]
MATVFLSPQLSLSTARAHSDCHSSGTHLHHRSWKFGSGQAVHMVFYGSNTRAFRVLTTANMSSRQFKETPDDIMVDPLEAKRLAAKQLREIQAKQELKRQRQIEAINGTWALIGLATGLVIEVQTGKSIPSQLAGYWDAVVGFLSRFIPHG